MAGILTGKRVLVVEDEYFIADDLRRALSAAGAEVLGPVGDLSAAIALARGNSLDAAILDVNLEGAASYPVADHLTAAGVPFAFVTGYDGWALAGPCRTAPRITKPVAPPKIVAVVQSLCTIGAAG